MQHHEIANAYQSEHRYGRGADHVSECHAEKEGKEEYTPDAEIHVMIKQSGVGVVGRGGRRNRLPGILEIIYDFRG